MNNKEQFDSIRKPMAPPVKVFKSKKDYSRVKSVEEAEELYLDDVEVEFQKITRSMKLTIDK